LKAPCSITYYNHLITGIYKFDHPKAGFLKIKGTLQMSSISTKELVIVKHGLINHALLIRGVPVII
jgi:hypothetical protein